MRTYWDLSVTERGALVLEDVQRYVDAELMLKGVLKVKPLALETAPDMPTPSGKSFVVRVPGKYGRQDVGVAFSKLSDAQAFLDLRPMGMGSEYVVNTTVAYLTPIVDPEIVELAIFTEAEKATVMGDLKRTAAILAANEKRTEEHRVASKVQEDALRGLWEDWNECRDHTAKLHAVADTFAEYKRTAGGDEAIAVSFLRKVYTDELIAQAAELHPIPAAAVTL